MKQDEHKISVKAHLGRYFDTRHSVVAVSVDDESRFLDIETRAFAGHSKVSSIFKWDATTVITEMKTGRKGAFGNMRELVIWFAKEWPENMDPSPADSAGGIINSGTYAPEGSILFVFDAMFYLQESSEAGHHSNAAITREIKNIMSSLVQQRKTIFLIGHGFNYVPPELKRVAPLLDYPLPDIDFLYGTVKGMTRCFSGREERRRGPEAAGGIHPEMGHEEILEVARLLLGLRNSEAQNILSGAVLENIKKRNAGITDRVEFDRDYIISHKMEAGKNNPAIHISMPKRKWDKDYVPLDEAVGGASTLKKWFMEQLASFSEDARLEGIDQPKGAVVFGMGGTGKDWIVEKIADEIGWPVINADLGATKGHLQGMSHKNFRNLLAFAEAQEPCFLVLSEWEKMMSGAMNSQSSAADGGTGQEMLATWLNWMQRRTKKVFVWGLTNDISGLSQASLRAGRWDMTWFMDLQNQVEREEVFKVHLKRTGWDPSRFDLVELGVLTEGYTGAEIRAVINEALRYKFTNVGSRLNGVMLTQEHLKGAIDRIPSTGKTRPAEVEALRKFAHDGGYQFANSPLSGAKIPAQAASLAKIRKAVEAKSA